jgi:uncharacterized protein YqeY
MLFDRVKERMFQAIKARRDVEKEILRTTVGEVTRTGDEPTDERVELAMRKLVKANRETLVVARDAEERERLEAEIAVLEEFLPQALGSDEIVAALADVADAIRAAAAAGPAMGIAMKHLKATGASVESRDVSTAVAQLRGS